jgi:ABC-type multidrug transport system fused ATPase/permease subunit
MNKKFNIKHLFTPPLNLFNAVFSCEHEKKYPWLPWVWIGLLFLAGALLWIYFLNFGNVPIDYMDWAEVWATRLQAWRDALLNNTLPFHLSDVGAMRTTGDRYFSVADMVSTPQLILLRWLEVGRYVLINNLLLYSFATYSLLKIRKKYGLSLIIFTVMFLLFQFNGFIVSHLSVGHLSWGGYYLFPEFTLYLLQLEEGDRSWFWVTKMAFLLFFMFLQGSFHHLVWCMIVLGILAVIRWRYFIPIFKAGTAAILLSMPRILPAAGRLGDFTDKTDFLGGYPRLINIFQAMVYNVTPDMGMPGKVFNSNLGYWEFDLFTGWAGLFFLIFCGVILMLGWHYREKKFPVLMVPVSVLAILSIGDNFFKVLFYNPVLVSSERVTSRMMGLALVMLIILAAIFYRRYFKTIRQTFSLKILQAIVLLLIAEDLVLHTLRWSVKNAFLAFPNTPRDLSLVHISNHADPPYFTALIVGSLISIFTMVVLIILAKKYPAFPVDPPGTASEPGN